MSDSMRAPLSTTLEEACRRWAARPAITFEGQTMTYETLWARVSSLAAAYAELGVGRGNRVLCQLRNCPEHVIAIAAAWVRGAVHVGADNDLTGAELARLVARLDAAALVFQSPTNAPEDVSALDVVAETAPQTRLIVHGPGGQHRDLASLLATSATVSPDLPGPLDPALVFLTSGTTGQPKAVVETLAAHWAKMQFFADGFLPQEDDVLLLYLPISHVFGLRLALLALLRGGHLVLLDRFSPARALDLVAEQRVTVLPAVPTHLRLLHDTFDGAQHDMRSLRWVLSAASGLPPRLAEWVYDVLRARIMFVFGCSEGFTTLTTEPDDILAGSVGSRVFTGPHGTPANGRVRIVDPDTRREIPPGEVGEIVFGAATPVRYWDQPDTATDGWYRTGDLGRLDQRGRLFVVGRLKELINRGGLHVSAAEVELALLRHPDVSDAAVIATPDPVLGEATCACVVPATSTPPDLEALRRFASASLARHKLPDELCIVNTIPRTVIGKVDRAALTARVLNGDPPRQQAPEDSGQTYARRGRSARADEA